MTCPICGENAPVDLTRKGVDVVCRKRKCSKCKHVFYTEEVEVKYHTAFLELEREYRKSLEEKRDLS